MSIAARRVVDAFVMADGRPRLPDDTLLALGRELQALPEVQWEPLAQELLAVARKFARVGGSAVDVALVQLCGLAALLIGVEQAAARFESTGLTDAARAVGATARAFAPAPLDKSLSPLQTLLRQRRT